MTFEYMNSSATDRIAHGERSDSSAELSQNIWSSMRHEREARMGGGHARGGNSEASAQADNSDTAEPGGINFGDLHSMQRLYGQFSGLERSFHQDVRALTNWMNEGDSQLPSAGKSGVSQAEAQSGTDGGAVQQPAGSNSAAEQAPSADTTITSDASAAPVPSTNSTAARGADAAPAAGGISAASLQPSDQGVVGGVLFGVDGHPEWGGSYNNLTPQQQADAVKAMGLGTYQADINEYSTQQTQALLTATENDGLQFLANIGANPSSFSDAQTAYIQSFQEGATEGQDFGSQIKLFQLGNEMDGFAEQSPQNFQISEAEIQGLTAGLKSTDAAAETIVNSTDTPTGIQFLNQLQADGVNWDITGFHSYTQNGDVADSGDQTTLASVAALGKPIYITEFNGWTSSDGATGPAGLPGNAQLITNSMNSIESVAQQYNIIGANVYELLDQPEISGSESGYGVLNADGSSTATSDAITAWMSSGGQTS